MQSADMEPRLGRLSRRILDHDALMTPILTSQFGAIVAHVTMMTTQTATILRQSTLHRKVDGEMILEATLKITKSGIPDAMLVQLERENTPFGQLLTEHGIATRIAARENYFQYSNDPEMIRWGRRHFIMNVADNSRICEVNELLVPEAKLALLVDFPAKDSDYV